MSQAVPEDIKSRTGVGQSRASREAAGERRGTSCRGGALFRVGRQAGDGGAAGGVREGGLAHAGRGISG